MSQKRTVITGTGCYIPPDIKTNEDFALHNFYGEDLKPFGKSPQDVIKKFEKITGIAERRYAPIEKTTSEIGAIAAELAIEDAGIDRETLDQIIVAHNFGDVIVNTFQTDAVPSIAARVKHRLGISNPDCVAYDLLFGCPGWLQGVIHSHAFMNAGIAKKCLVIGAETLSRVIDEYDRDSMIFADGAGASVLELKEDEGNNGILSTAVQSHTNDETFFINLEKSYYPGANPNIRYLKMKGRKVYEYALKQVPEAMKLCLDKAGVDISEVKKVFIHQANEKMDEAIIKALYKLFNVDDVHLDIMPMNIRELGNSSVATIPTLLDMVLKGTYTNHQLQAGDIVLFASVGAGMNINAVCYRM